MCIAIVKPKGVKLPSYDILENCYLENSHGGGYAFVGGGEVTINKGYFDLTEMYKALKEDIKEETLALIHFRIATAGSISAENCHPFPVSSQERELKELAVKTDMAVIHNGIISAVETKKEEDLSDTQVFIKEILAEEIVKKNLFYSPTMQKLISSFVGSSKLALINAKEEVLMLGNFIENEGVYYSNHGFMTFDYGFAYDYGYNNKWSWVEKLGKLRKKKKVCFVCGRKMAGDFCHWCGLSENDMKFLC